MASYRRCLQCKQSLATNKDFTHKRWYCNSCVTGGIQGDTPFVALTSNEGPAKGKSAADNQSDNNDAAMRSRAGSNPTALAPPPKPPANPYDTSLDLFGGPRRGNNDYNTGNDGYGGRRGSNTDLNINNNGRGNQGATGGLQGKWNAPWAQNSPRGETYQYTSSYDQPTNSANQAGAGSAMYSNPNPVTPTNTTNNSSSAFQQNASSYRNVTPSSDAPGVSPQRPGSGSTLYGPSPVTPTNTSPFQQNTAAYRTNTPTRSTRRDPSPYHMDSPAMEPRMTSPTNGAHRPGDPTGALNRSHTAPPNQAPMVNGWQVPPQATGTTQASHQVRNNTSASPNPLHRMNEQPQQNQVQQQDPVMLGKDELVQSFERLEGHFEAINRGRHITFESIVQPQPHPLVPTNEPGHMCDFCVAPNSSYTCAYRDCPAKMWVCTKCRDDGVTLHPWRITKQKEWAYTLLRNWFEKMDRARLGQLDFLQFLNYCYELAPLLEVSPANGMLIAVRRAFEQLQDDKGQLNEIGVRNIVRRWLSTVPAHTETIFLHMARSPTGSIGRYDFLKLLYSVVSTRAKYLSQSVIKLKRQKPRICTVNRNERANPTPIVPQMNGPVELKKVRLLGKGGQGMVWEVMYRGIRAAAKYPHANVSAITLNQMVRATELQSRIQHPNVLRVYEIVKTYNPPILVLELAKGGDVDDLYACQIAKPLQWRLARETAAALNALHTHDPPIVHRDIKGANILLSEDLHVKLADFDMALPVPCPVAGGLFGTPGFMSPEVMLPDSFYDQRADIFSFASVLYEVTHNAFPFSKEVDQSLGAEQWYNAVMEITLQGLRPQLDPDRCPLPMRQLMNDCWASDPNKRPSMQVVMERLDAMQGLYE